METIREKEDGWEGDLIINLLISGEGRERRVWILTDQGKYIMPIADVMVSYASDEYSSPLYNPNTHLILIGQETELRLPEGKERKLVEKVIQIALSRKFR